MRRKISILSAGILLSAMLMAGCSGKTAETGTETEAGTEEVSETVQETEEVQELVVGIPDAVKSIDPMSQDTTVYGGNAIGHVFDTLVANNFETTEIIPCLAETWDISEDGLVYTFHLRDDVYFHEGEYQDGRQMVAEDVVYTFNRIKELYKRNRTQIDNITEIQAVDAQTVEFTLAKPDSQLLAVITQENFSIVPKEEVEGMGEEFASKGIGTGPYKMEELSADNYVKMVKNEKYWAGEPKVDKVTFEFIADANTMANALRSGEIDIAANLNADFMAEIEKEEDLTVVNTPMRQHVALLHMNMAEGPTADIKVREAIIKAVDIDGMVAGIYQNKEGTRTYLPVPKASWGYDESLEELVPDYDPEGAKQLLAEAGYPDGFELNLYMGANPIRNKMAAILQQQLKENLNITLNIHASDWAGMAEVVTKGKADIYAASFAFSESGDPYFYLNGFFNTLSIGSTPNGGGFSDPEIDSLLEETTRMEDAKERGKVYSQIMTKALKQYPGIYYANENLIYAYNNKVKDFRINPSTIFRLESVSIEE